MIVRFGDRPGHTGASVNPSSPFNPYPWPGTLSDVITALTNANIRVYPVSVGSGLGIQAPQIAAGTGGQNFAVGFGSLVSVITAAVTSAVSTFSSVVLHVDQHTCAQGKAPQTSTSNCTSSFWAWLTGKPDHQTAEVQTVI